MQRSCYDNYLKQKIQIETKKKKKTTHLEDNLIIIKDPKGCVCVVK